MYDVIIFGGTTEGREMAEFLSRQNVAALVCVATSYGASLLPAGENLTISNDPLSEEEMETLFKSSEPKVVIDGTHPYAAEATANIRKACQNCGTEYLRLLREERGGVRDGAGDGAGSGEGSETRAGAVFVNSLDEAVEYLSRTEGRILATTGSKELYKYTKLKDYEDRVVARVLSTAQAASQCEELGFEGKNLICMQGPFSKEMNAALLRQCGCRYLVTKSSGHSGGYDEKIEAAFECGCIPIVIGRPEEETGLSYFQCKKEICGRLHLNPQKEISLIGIGMGSRESMTVESLEAVEKAELVIGAARMVDAVASPGQDRFVAYAPDMIAGYIKEHREYEKIAVVFSGDIGFYSGAKKLTMALDGLGYILEYLPGVSSLSYFAGRLGKSWEDAVIVSNHGAEVSLIPLIRDNPKVFSILGKRDSVREIAGKLAEYNMNHVRIYVGEQLSYPEEKLSEGYPEDYLDYENDPLAVIMLENDRTAEDAVNMLTVRRDEEFIRDRVPMTKEEIRCLSVSRLELKPDAICYDVGAGTGSVSVEMAVRVPYGKVYAIEKKQEAVELISKNRQKFRADNIEIISGTAPEALENLPAPTHVFIGGSSGNMEEIIAAVLAKNPKARIVINCIALESVAEGLECAKKFSCGGWDISQVSVSRGREVGRYTMMNGENPITIISFNGRCKAEEEGEGEGDLS